MSTDPSRRHAHLIEGMVAPEHEHLYLTSPTFHAEVQALAKLLPDMVAGLAAAATAADERHERLMAMSVQPLTGKWPMPS